MKDPGFDHVSRVELSVPARDEYPLGATLYGPEDASSTIVIFGATAVPQRYYDRFARFLGSEGHRVVTFDYRGVGRSRPQSLRGFEATMTEWATKDAGGVLDWVRDSFGGRFAFVGHSFGGQLIGLLPDVQVATGAVLAGAQFGYYGHWPTLSRLRLLGLLRFAIPALVSIFGYLPGKAGLGTDLPGGVAEEWARWCRHPRYLAGYHWEAPERFAGFRIPTALLTATDDDFAPRPAVDALAALLPGDNVVHRVLRPERIGGPIGHFGFFRPALQSALWADIAGFFDDVFAGRPPRIESDVPPPPPAGWLPMPSPEEILSDLNYGRT